MSTMRAFAVPEAGSKLQMIERDLPTPGPGEVRCALPPAVCATATP